MNVEFDEIGRLPAPTDNVAIATRTLNAGTVIALGGETFALSHTVLVGHRFAVKPIAAGEPLLSWGQTFGLAIKPISPGDYVCNVEMIHELSRRDLDFDLPTEPNFQNELEPYTFDETTFRPAPALPRHAITKTFMGYRRDGGRGVGTRNMVVLLGTTSLASGFVRRLESRLQDTLADYPNIDGIVAVAHTEGGHGESNNRDLLLRTLAGFMTHPNVGAVLAVDYGHEAINNAALQDYMQQNDYPLSHVLHAFMSLSHAFEEDLAAAEQGVTGWLHTVNQAARTAQPLSELKVALQCGGSDAFSGVSGNPLAAWVARDIIQYGGCANLAETDELIGAERYVLDKVRDAATAKRFLAFIDRFKERVGWHGHTADGNPSGGNKYRGLYNIYLKSLGAATKRHPDVPLDTVIEYAERMQQPGYYFMDSPGNDLESIAGQVAAGCNMIFFVTGNGSITNFPFVPTIKIVTTTDRYNLLSEEMDVNAGRYLDGTPMATLGNETLQLTIDAASGQRTVGEKAGHAQVQIWRDWQQTRPVELEQIQSVTGDGQPIAINTDHVAIPDRTFPAFRIANRYTSDRVGLILPTSLCSGQIARMCVEHLNKQRIGQQQGLSRFVTLVHTEGCGGSINDEFRSTLLGYLAHPFVAHALLLEHGCEITHNDYFRHAMLEQGYNPADYGWASIQMDGGIQPVMHKMANWFKQQLEQTTPVEKGRAGLGALRVALVTQGVVSESVAASFARLTQIIVAAGGLVVIGEHDPLLQSTYVDSLSITNALHPTLSYAQDARKTGFHIMAMPTSDWGEILTGLGAAGVEIMLAYHDNGPLPGHPMIPVLQISEEDSHSPEHAAADIVLKGASTDWHQQILDAVLRTLAHEYTPKTTASGNVNFQITRGLLGVSL